MVGFERQLIAIPYSGRFAILRARPKKLIGVRVAPEASIVWAVKRDDYE